MLLTLAHSISDDRSRSSGVSARVPEPAERIGDQRELRLHDLGERAAVDVGPEVLRLTQRRRVERPGLHPVGTQVAQARTHLAGGPGRERDREDLGRLVDAGRHAVGDAVRDRPGLAGAGTRDDADRSAQRPRDLALLGVETRQQVVGIRHTGSSGECGESGQVLRR